MSLSPTVEGFRAAFRRPSLALAEITWRWSVGATATALLLFGFFEFLRTLPVTRGDLLFLRTGQPILVGQALSHILRGSLSRVVVATVVGMLAMTCLWIFAASLGRLATVRSMLDHFRSNVAYVSAAVPSNTGQDLAGNVSTNDVPADPKSAFRAMTGLNFLRAALALATIFSLVAASTLAGFASPDAHPRPGLAFLLFLPLAGLICLISWALNWILSLAGIFAVRDGDGALGAVSAAVVFVRERLGPVAAVSTWVGLAHLTAFMAANSAVAVPLSMAQILPGRVVVLSLILLTLAYFAVADWLYIARFAGYVCILEMPEALLAPIPRSPAPIQAPTPAAIDRDEVILSDLPLAAES
jgi:hypothetical protein